MAPWLRQASLSLGTAVAHAAATDALGNSLGAGSFRGGLSWGGASASSPTASAALIVQADAQGIAGWALAGIPQNEGWAEAQTIAVDSAGKVVVAGEFVGTLLLAGQSVASVGVRDIWLARLDAQGQLMWLKTFGVAGSAASVSSVTVGPAGEIALAARHDGGTDFGGGALGTPGTPGTVVALFNSAGDHQRGADYGDGQWPAVIAFTATGGIVLAGARSQSLTVGQSLLPPTTASAENRDLFVVALDPSGQFLWARRWATRLAQTITAIAIEPNSSEVVLAGSFSAPISLDGLELRGSGRRSVLLAKLGSDGTPLWGRAWGGNTAHATSVDVDATGAVVVGGSFTGKLDIPGGLAAPSGDDTCLWTARLTPAGDLVWARKSVGFGLGGVASTLFDANGDVRVAVSFAGELAMDGLSAAPAEQATFFIARISG